MGYLITVENTNTRGPEEPRKVYESQNWSEVCFRVGMIGRDYRESLETGCVSVTVVNEEAL